MKLYRAHHYTDMDGSDGYTWHTSRLAAQQALRQDRNKVETDDKHVEAVHFAPTKRGILDLLTDYASYADNG